MDKWVSIYLNELKKFGEKEKLLVMSNFSFSHNVFKSCLLLMRQNEYLWSKGLTLSQTTNFRLFQTERLCRRQFQILITIAESSPNGYKTLWEKEKLLVTSNFSFSHSVFTRLVLQIRKNQGLFGKEFMCCLKLLSR